MKSVCTFLLLAVALGPLPLVTAEELSIEDVDFPSQWVMTYTKEFTAMDLARFSQRQGVKIESIRNHIFNAGGRRLQINVVECANEKDARVVYGNIARGTHGLLTHVVKGKRVFEFAGGALRIIRKARHSMGFPFRERVVYKAKFDVVPISKCDYMLWNKMYQRLSGQMEEPESQETIEGADRLVESFVFSHQITLRTPGDPAVVPVFTFSKDPVKVEALEDRSLFVFDLLEKKKGCPFVGIEAVVTAGSYTSCPISDSFDPKKWIVETPHWPVQHEKIFSVLDSLLEDSMTVREKVETVQCWVREKISFSGTVTGSRYGTLQVMKQGFGHCWDQSDVFITLLRAAGIPARQVMGWLANNGGHVWAEVCIPKLGWIQVDPMLSWLGVDEEYIPFVTSSSGEISFVYMTAPSIEVVKEE